MNFTAFVDVAIGLTLIYLGVSLFVTVANEFIAQWLNSRGEMLVRSLKALFDDPALEAMVKKAPLLDGLFDGERKRSYVDPLAVAQALVAGLAPGKSGNVVVMQEVLNSLQTLKDSRLKTALLGIAASANNDVQVFTTSVSAWIDRSLSALSEIYKRNTQLICLLLGFVLAIAFNVDTVALTHRLYVDNGLRNDMVAAATRFVEKTSAETLQKCLDMKRDDPKYATDCATVSQLATAVKDRKDAWGRLPIGWSAYSLPPAGIDIVAQLLLQFAGWLLTGLAVSLGAPFWFDLLNKFVNLRHAMDKSKVETQAP